MNDTFDFSFQRSKLLIFYKSKLKIDLLNLFKINYQSIFIEDDNLILSKFNILKFENKIGNNICIKINSKNDLLTILSEINKEFIFIAGTSLSKNELEFIFRNVNFCGMYSLHQFNDILKLSKIPKEKLINHNKNTSNPKVNDQTKIGVLLRQWDSFNITSICIRDLLKQNYKNFQIFLLDDASNDLSFLKLYLNYPEISIINIFSRAEYCLGFNILAKYSILNGCKYIFIVNNDTRNFSTNLLNELKLSFNNVNIGIASPKVYDFNGQKLHWQKRKWLNIPFNIATEGYMIPSELWEKIDGFNNSYFRYCEDLDLVKRIEEQDKIQFLVKNVSFEHLGNGTSRKMVFIPIYYYIRNMIWIQGSYNNNLEINHILSAWYKVKPLMNQKKQLISKIYFISNIIVYFYTILGFISGLIFKPKNNYKNSIYIHLSKTKNNFIFKLK